ncbi:SRPBCC domain-containing protein [Achromobacter sp. SD115]|uniref:SRPBCC family protein n=1 Tax=Achromobacter sp. SD115 TaxID=2782011 RepID=UPI001A95DC03|nr:SRPBCC domain-containing protein [Achromobacter sp. SD115]MBO1015714.1 SRPBCC domain-containing protein [Achromobacter sp. SD115]
MENRSTQDESAPIELRLKRRFDAPVERVWRAWTDPQALMRWFGPAETRKVLRAETDVRVGGAYEVGFATEDGLEHHASGHYREVEPQRRLVFTWAWRDTPAEVSLITLEFTPAGSGTELAFLQTPFVDQATRDSHQHGWSGALERLAADLANPA